MIDVVNYSNLPTPKSTTLLLYGGEDVWNVAKLKEFRAIHKQSWIYYDMDITYKFNKHGFRMKEFSDVSSEYIAFIGCSYILGAGLRMEDRCSDIVASHFGIDYVNLGICGGSNDMILYNLKQLLKCSDKPKTVVIAWTHTSRKSYWYKDTLYSFTQNNISTPSNKIPRLKTYKDFFSHLTESYNEFNDIVDTSRMLCDAHGIQLIEFAFFDEIDDENIKTFKRKTCEDIECFNKHKARDLLHPGIQCNYDASLYIINSIKNFNKEKKW